MIVMSEDNGSVNGVNEDTRGVWGTGEGGADTDDNGDAAESDKGR